MGLEEIPYAPMAPGIYASTYDYNTFELFTESEAAAAGVPAGYSGYVLKLTGDSDIGIGLDFTDQHIPAEDVQSMTLIQPTLTWSEGAVDENGLLLKGTHTLTVTATDLTGLQSQITVTFIVRDQADVPMDPTPAT